MAVITFNTFERRSSRIILFRGHPLRRRNTAQLNSAPYDCKEAETELFDWLDVYRYASCNDMQLLTTAEKGVSLLSVSWAVKYGIPVDIFIPFEEEIFMHEKILHGVNQSEWKDRFVAAQESSHARIHTPVFSDTKQPALYKDLGVEDTVLDFDITTFLLSILTSNDEVVLYWDGLLSEFRQIARICKMHNIKVRVLTKGLKEINETYSGYSLSY